MAKSEKPSKQEATQQDKITAKKIGVNLIATIDGQKYSAKLDPEALEIVKKKIELYNKRNTDSNKKAIIKLLTPETVKKQVAKEKLEVKQKGIKKLVKKNLKEAKIKSGNKETKILIKDVELALEAKDLTVAELEDLLRRAKGIEEKVAPAEVTEKPRGGESYRRW